VSAGQPKGKATRAEVHRFLAEVLESERLPGDYHRLLLRAPRLAEVAALRQAQGHPEPLVPRSLGEGGSRGAAPGQFLHLWCHPPEQLDHPPSAALLRRPYSISRLRPPDGVELLIRLRGVGGRLLAAKRPGDQLDALGPLGNGFRLDASLATAVVVAGGSGLAPVPFLIARLVETGARVVCLVGAMTDEEVPFRVVRPRVGRATLPEIEALGAEVTFVSEAVEGILVTQVVELRLTEFGDAGAEMFAIGPRAMLKRLHEVTGEHIPLQVSLEERMACGLGACRSCVVPVKSESGPAYKTVCRDGPIFDSTIVDWERLEP